ncbi:unnamed protein product [Orchesella dallaii]|uniref:ABC transporter domain-containing protein n=1 Tax=Orchesella dallaii TaxID=48710 RepID=A0ABP1PLM6_9HEXA
MHGWQSGKIAVFGRHRDENEKEVLGRICGYMPQDTSMLSLLTIKETIEFFGKLYNMSEKNVNDQISSLTTLLQLPSKNKLIKNLSGGETRRVSLALALLHSPQLLILDEPTVGLDPLLRQSIWNHLKRSVEKNNTTIIITTHYIEEAKLSNIMGFMRHGRLLFEDIPAKLLQGLQCELLDDAILILCRKDGDLKNNKTFNKVENSNCNPKFQSKPRKGSTENCELEGKYRKLNDFDEERMDIQHLKKIRNERIIEKVEEENIPGMFSSLKKIQGLTTILFLTLIRHYL